jgi:hypothetical protein
MASFVFLFVLRVWFLSFFRSCWRGVVWCVLLPIYTAHSIISSIELSLWVSSLVFLFIWSFFDRQHVWSHLQIVYLLLSLPFRSFSFCFLFSFSFSLYLIFSLSLFSFSFWISLVSLSLVYQDPFPFSSSSSLAHLFCNFSLSV